MTVEDIEFLRDTARKAGFLAGMEAAAKIADQNADDEFGDPRGNTDKGVGARNAAEDIRIQAKDKWEEFNK